ncbi:MAG: hypothetical protein H6718_21475 [Polyangiaceae bacterium]|nr:hypothetical protein [Myxococcales bacterium]MCB9587991.1 hypothetical protein [Polyangiaceae bacterium]
MSGLALRRRTASGDYMLRLTKLTTLTLTLALLGLGVSSAEAKPKAKSASGSSRAEALRAPTPKSSIDTPKAKTAKGKPLRRSQRHSKAQSKKPRTERIDTVIVTGRAMRPQAVIEIPKVQPKFKSGTTKYSPRDRAYQK